MAISRETILPCEQNEVTAIRAVPFTLIARVFTERCLSLETGSMEQVNDEEGVIYGELFRLCVVCSKEPDNKEMPKKLIINGIGYKSEKTVNKQIVNILTTTKNSCRLNLEQDKDRSKRNLFYTHWNVLPLSDYSGAENTEKEEKYNYPSHTTENDKFPTVTFTVELKNGEKKDVL